MIKSLLNKTISKQVLMICKKYRMEYKSVYGEGTIVQFRHPIVE
ncbi:hypothetical protein [Clostridium puniceum]|nr:hypothetical protein [Clostridium puniceum]